MNPPPLTVASLAHGLTHLARAVPVSPVRAVPGAVRIGDATAAPDRIGPQAAAAMADLGWDWDATHGCWVAPAP